MHYQIWCILRYNHFYFVFWIAIYTFQLIYFLFHCRILKPNFSLKICTLIKVIFCYEHISKQNALISHILKYNKTNKNRNKTLPRYFYNFSPDLDKIYALFSSKIKKNQFQVQLIVC